MSLMDDARTHARRHDPGTSKRAAEKVVAEPSAKNQAGKLLNTFRWAQDPINYRRACHETFGELKAWQRVSDLHFKGYIEVVDDLGDMSTYILTDKGFTKWKELFSG